MAELRTKKKGKERRGYDQLNVLTERIKKRWDGTNQGQVH
jgi:hypothetical protein